MKNKAKIIILALVFVLPVATFLFLKFFGENKFDIPIIVDAATVANCGEELSGTLSKGIDIIFLKNASCENIDCGAEIDQFKRIAQRYKQDSTLRYSMISEEVVDIRWPYGNLSVYTLNEESNFDCLSLPEKDNNYFILLDAENKLRGIYEIERNEVDRLMVELDILRKYS